MPLDYRVVFLAASRANSPFLNAILLGYRTVAVPWRARKHQPGVVGIPVAVIGTWISACQSCLCNRDTGLTLHGALAFIKVAVCLGGAEVFARVATGFCFVAFWVRARRPIVCKLRANGVRFFTFDITESKVTLAVGADIRHEHLSATVLRMRATYNLALASRNIFIHRPKRNSVTVSRDSFD
jgi:hypothetical protein